MRGSRHRHASTETVQQCGLSSKEAALLTREGAGIIHSGRKLHAQTAPPAISDDSDSDSDAAHTLGQGEREGGRGQRCPTKAALGRAGRARRQTHNARVGRDQEPQPAVGARSPSQKHALTRAAVSHAEWQPRTTRARVLAAPHTQQARRRDCIAARQGEPDDTRNPRHAEGREGGKLCLRHNLATKSSRRDRDAHEKRQLTLTKRSRTNTPLRHAQARCGVEARLGGSRRRSVAEEAPAGRRGRGRQA